MKAGIREMGSMPSLVVALIVWTSGAVGGLAATDQWTHLYTTDGFSVFESTEDRMPKYLARGQLKVNFYHLLAIMSDIPRRMEWVDRLSEIRIMEGDIFSRVVIYNRLDLPWPIADRDSVLEASLTLEATPLTAVIHLRNIDRMDVTPQDGVVRVHTVSGRTTLKYVNEELTEVSDELMFDPGGNIPRWIAKIIVEDAPIQTLRNLLKQAEKTKGQYDSYIHQLRLQQGKP